jgi:hypothetical protein
VFDRWPDDATQTRQSNAPHNFQPSQDLANVRLQSIQFCSLLPCLPAPVAERSHCSSNVTTQQSSEPHDSAGSLSKRVPDRAFPLCASGKESVRQRPLVHWRQQPLVAAPETGVTRRDRKVAVTLTGSGFVPQRYGKLPSHPGRARSRIRGDRCRHGSELPALSPGQRRAATLHSISGA